MWMEKSEVPTEKSPLIERIVTSDKTAEIVAGQAMIILEDSRRMISQPHKPLFDLEAEQISFNPPDTMGGWVFHHVGDVEEVAYLFSATRLALVGVNEVLKKVTKKEIPDEACFWASLVTSVAIPSMMELNMVPLFKNLNTADPADLFGVGIGALVIIATHYGSKNREVIKSFTSSVASKITEKAKLIKEKIDPKIGYVDSSQLAKR